MSLNRDEIEFLVASLEHLQGEAFKQAAHFEQLEAFCLFVGYPRSGHSLLGALLNAHPDMVIAHELDCLRCLRAGFGREAIYALILEAAADFHARGQSWNGHRYAVENQWQGRFRQLRVIGDKKGGGTSRWLSRHPRLLDRLHSTLALPVKFIHVVRDPIENIPGISRELELSVDEAAALYFAMAASVEALKSRVPPDSLHEIHYEDFAREPGWNLRETCRFLGQEAPADYLRDCAAIVKPALPRAGDRLLWPVPLLDRVRREAACYGFLSRYFPSP